MLLGMNLLAVGTGLVIGWSAIVVVADEIEHRLVDEALDQAARLITQMNLPRSSDSLLEKVGQILGAEVACGPVDGSAIEAAGFGQAGRDDLLAAVSGGRTPRTVRLGDTTYRLGVADVPHLPATDGAPPARLYLLVAEERISSAKADAARTIVWVTLGAVAAATLLATWLSHTITRPVRRLASRMDRLSLAAGDVRPGAMASAEGRDHNALADEGPAEIARLVEAFERLLAQLDQTRSKLLESARLATLGRFSATVAHELRNPLSGIKMNARVLSDELARLGTSDESLERIVREIDRMDTHLQELLALAGPGGGEVRPTDGPMEAVDLAAVAESVVSLVENRCRKLGIAVERDLAPAVVRGHENRLRQTVLNLTLNAVDAMPEGGTLRLTVGGTNSDHVRFTVSDTGGGVHVPDGQDPFAPFVTTKHEGAGLGLSICRSIIEQHGGRIGHDSSPGGTTFWFELPKETA